MTANISRRDLLKAVSAASAGAIVSPHAFLSQSTSSSQSPQNEAATEEILPLNSTSDVLVPTPGHAFMKFSFNFPEPSVTFGELRIGFRVNTFENVYALDQQHMTAERVEDGLDVRCTQLLWAGGQEPAAGNLFARIRRNGPHIECSVDASAPENIKSVAIAVRGVPRGQICCAGQTLFDPKDDEILLGYPFSAGGLFGPNASRSMETPIAIVHSGAGNCFFFSCLDDRVRPKRFYFQPGRDTYRVDLIFEREGWERSTHITTPIWRMGSVPSVEAAMALHYAHVERAFQLPLWDTRADVPNWFRKTALVLTLHGADWTGYIFNDFPKMSNILSWVATQIPPENVLVFLPAWDGRYYWNYPLYKPDDRMGGEKGLARLLQNGHRQGFHFIPMFGSNVANRRHSVYARFADASVAQIDGDSFSDNWTDWDRDGHSEGGQPYLNLGVDSWRTWLHERIADIMTRFNVDGYFLDIAGGWINNPKADMHQGICQLVEGLRKVYPESLACGEFYYDALLAAIPVYQAFGQWSYDSALLRYGRAFQHLSHPAPGRGSTGVHEFGFRQFDPTTLSLNDVQIPTISVVNDTFDRHRDTMTAIIRKARERTGIQV